MSLFGSAIRRKFAQSIGVWPALRRAAILRAAAGSRWRTRAALQLALYATLSPAWTLAQSDPRRPMRQVESDDGVIEITNSDEAAARPAPPEELIEVRALRPTPERGDSQAPGPGEARSLASATPTPQPVSSSWWLPLLVLVIAGGVCVWGLRRRGSLRETSGALRRATQGELREPVASGEGNGAHSDAVFDADVLDDPAPFAASPGELARPPGQWVEAVRDSVPPSSPPRSSRGANAPRQWVSQALRIKSDGS